MKSRYFLLTGSLLGMLAVIFGAFGAHGLEKLLDAKMLARFHTGVEYQFYHALALLCVGMLLEKRTQSLLVYAGHAFTAGVLLFSGSLYLYVLTGIKAIAMITPVGGMAFILGWALLFLGLRKHSQGEPH